MTKPKFERDETIDRVFFWKSGHLFIFGYRGRHSISTI